LGTYLHGLFENESIRAAFVEAVFDAAGMSRPAEVDEAEGSGEGVGATADPYDRAAALVADNVDLGALGIDALGLEVTESDAL